MEGLFVKKKHLMILLLNVYPLYYYQYSITIDLFIIKLFAWF